MISVREVIVCEGRYDKDTLSQVFDAVIIETGGFGVFNDREKLELLRRLAEARGLVILTDSDAAGFQIGRYLKHAYIPDVPGREKRKKTASRAGTLGVEGMKPEVLVDALRRAGATLDGQSAAQGRGDVTSAELYELGLMGREGSTELRAALLASLGLPAKLKGGALRDVLGALYTRDELEAAVRRLASPL